jgi:3-hydroxyacyl-CoA dehydrogenase/enoyl-CoA hydratase/3-hydroxybutyryl-CoA epimerase/enoyl-CoA isomerase
MFKGQSIKLIQLNHGLVELCFDRNNSEINKLDASTLSELAHAVELIEKNSSIKGLLISSAKKVFIVGADITEFGELFKQDAAAIAAYMMQTNRLFSRIEDLSIPSVATINGFALGGGLELALTASYRIMSETAAIGLPEVKLGLLPGYGGTVRLSRLAGPAVAIDWVCSGKQINAATALSAGVADQVCEENSLHQMALDFLKMALTGEVNWSIRQAHKKQALSLPSDVVDSIFEPAILKAKAKITMHQPATLMGLTMMQKACKENRDKALEQEAIAFGLVSQTQAANAMIQTFLSEQMLKKRARLHAQKMPQVKAVAILGAGNMGAGIAGLIANFGMNVRLIDNNLMQLDKGMHVIHRQLQKLVAKGVISVEKSSQIQKRITPQSHLNGLEDVDLVIEAVTEDLESKKQLLQSIEKLISPHALLATNTSSLRIDDIGASLNRPEILVGMHFFNPVADMPLVEVIQGKQSAPSSVSQAVDFAMLIGKLPIVIQDSSGFLVNRTFTAYMRAFEDLLVDGADFVEVDRVMESFGWPLGPAALLDMLGIDICCNASQFISLAHSQHLGYTQQSILKCMVQHQRLGQKNGVGFYHYADNDSGKLTRKFKPEALAFLSQYQTQGTQHFEDSVIIDRLMLPLMLEACRALDEKVANSPEEIDIALLQGAGVPAYLGGPLKLIDWWGVDAILEKSLQLSNFGPMYHAPESLKKMGQSKETFYNN